MLLTDHEPSSTFTGGDTDRARMLVTRRRPSDRAYEPIGYLDLVLAEDGRQSFRFSYLQAAVKRGIAPVIGFSDLTRVYRSERLFPSFAERVISAKRPDRSEYLRGLSLSESAGPWEILAASGGHREGDPIELIPLPSYIPASGHTEGRFLAHGVRHVKGADAVIAELTAGDPLTLEPDPTNPKDSRAVKIVSGGARLGYVPAPLVDYVHSLLNSGAQYSAQVVKANSAKTHPHLRLLLRVEGECKDYVFDRPEWAAV